MLNCQDDFGPFDGKIWLNTASEGPLPKIALPALQEVVAWKLKPYDLTNRRFREAPQNLKSALGKLLNVNSDEIILGNSATHGMHLLANGLKLAAGDEVLLMQNDFPTSILPWLALVKKGINVRQIPPRQYVLSPEEIKAHLTPQTRVVCLSHVHSFSGHSVDVAAIGRLCRQEEIIFIVNASQSIGYWPVNLEQWPVDALVCAGFKWLCGPYGTGFCWIKPSLRQTLDYPQAFWLNCLTPLQLESGGDLGWPMGTDAKRYDVLGTANFFNFAPWTAAINYLQQTGIERIWEHNQQLIEQVIGSLDLSQYQLVSPLETPLRSGLVVFSHIESKKNSAIFDMLLARGIFLALWKGNLRISPHLFNTSAEIQQLTEALNAIA